MSLFSQQTYAPLAARMRPVTLDEYVGQSHLVGPGKPLRKMLESSHCHSMVLWGPPGTGKTTMAELIAVYTNAQVIKLSAVTSGVKEIRAAMDEAEQNKSMNTRSVANGRIQYNFSIHQLTPHAGKLLYLTSPDFTTPYHQHPHHTTLDHKPHFPLNSTGATHRRPTRRGTPPRRTQHGTHQ